MPVVHAAVIRARHRVWAMIGDLGVEPLVDGGDQGGISRGVGDLGAILEFFVLDAELPRFGLAKLGETRHIRPMDFRRIGKIAPAEFLRNLRQVLPYQCDLLSVGRVFGDNLLDSPGLGLVEDVLGLFEVERHDLRTAPGDFFLAGICGFGKRRRNT